MAAPADGRIIGVEAPTVVADLDRPASVVSRHSDADRAWLCMLAGVLEGFLDDAERDDLDRLRQAVDGPLDTDADGHAQRRLDLVRRLGEGAAQPEVGQERRAKLAEVGADAL